MSKSLGNVRSMRLFLDKPIKMVFQEIELNRINLLVGMNGSGKSLINAIMYALSYIVNSEIISRANNVPFDSLEVAKFVIKSCFNSGITGTIALNYENSVSIDVAVKDGDVLNVNINGSEGVDTPTPVKYMSAAFRTFSAMCSYLVARKHYGKTKVEEVVMEMAKYYRLYDVMYIETLIHRMPIVVDDELKSHLRGFGIKEDVGSFEVDLENCVFNIRLNGSSVIPMHKYFGDGHQSLINMTLGQII